MLKDKVMALIAKENNKSNKKKIENIVVFIVILIITVIAINTIWNEDNNEKSIQKNNMNEAKELAEIQQTSDISNSVNTQNTMEKNLEEILSNIEGVGKVKVLITYSESSQIIAMYNENSKNSQIEEQDSRRTEQGLQHKQIQQKILYIKRKTEKKYQ